MWNRDEGHSHPSGYTSTGGAVPCMVPMRRSLLSDTQLLPFRITIHVRVYIRQGIIGSVCMHVLLFEYSI